MRYPCMAAGLQPKDSPGELGCLSRSGISYLRLTDPSLSKVESPYCDGSPQSDWQHTELTLWNTANPEGYSILPQTSSSVPLDLNCCSTLRTRLDPATLRLHQKFRQPGCPLRTPWLIRRVLLTLYVSGLCVNHPNSILTPFSFECFFHVVI